MQQKSDAVVFLALALPVGGIRHFTLLANELCCSPNRDFDIYYASITREWDAGCWDLAKSVYPESRQLKADSFEKLIERVYEVASGYRKVILHTGGGWGQTQSILNVRKGFPKDVARRVLLVATTHSYRIESWKRFPMSVFQYVLYRLFFRKVVFQCQYAADRFIGGKDLIRRGLGTIVPLGCEKIDDCLPAEVTAQKSGGVWSVLEDEKLVKFVYLAAFRPGKNQFWLVQSMAPVLKRFPQAILLLCGKENDEIVDSIRVEVEKQHIAEQVIIPGQIQRRDVPFLLKKVDCAIVASGAETFGHCYLEPMFAGLPVVGTRVGVGRDIIRDGVSGYGFSLDDPQSFVKAVEQILIDKDRAKEMGRRARELVCREYTHAEVARRLTEVYREVFSANVCESE